MTPTTQVATFEASEAFRDNPALLNLGFNIVLKAQGARAPGYYGKQIENPSTGYIIFNWDSFEAHQAVIDGPSHSEIREALKPSVRAGGKVEMYHVQFSGPTIALDKPVTSVLILTLKAPENREAVVDTLSGMSAASEKLLVFGKTHEDENKYILIGGWATVEAQSEFAAKPEMAAAIDKLGSLANKDHLCHTMLTGYHGL